MQRADVGIANLRQNLVLAFGYNIAVIPLAAGLLYSVTGGLLSPMVAATAMALSSISIVLNAARLIRFTPPQPGSDQTAPVAAAGGLPTGAHRSTR